MWYQRRLGSYRQLIRLGSFRELGRRYAFNATNLCHLGQKINQLQVSHTSRRLLPTFGEQLKTGITNHEEIG